MKILLIGLGTVGQSFYDLLEKKGLNKLVKYIVVKDPQKSRQVATELIHYQWSGLIEDEEIDYVVELIDDAQVALSIARQTLSAGKVLISANKKMLADHLPELEGLKASFGGDIAYEASVAGAIPIIKTLRQYFEQGEVLGIEAILNGSTNYILEQVAQGHSYELALQNAQALGFAESDPFLDVSGWDATYKLSLLIYLASGHYIPPQKIPRSGLELLEGAKTSPNLERKPKLIATWSAEKENQTKVGLEYLDHSHPLFAIPAEENAILLHTVHGGSYLLQGKGAGANPTAWAVYSDLKALVNHAIPVL